jgi:hypothetical protein
MPRHCGTPLSRRPLPGAGRWSTAAACGDFAAGADDAPGRLCSGAVAGREGASGAQHSALGRERCFRRRAREHCSVELSEPCGVAETAGFGCLFRRIRRAGSLPHEVLRRHPVRGQNTIVAGRAACPNDAADPQRRPERALQRQIAGGFGDRAAQAAAAAGRW